MRELAQAGSEGVVAKGADQPYAGGRRDWIKVMRRDAFELVAGAVTGTLTQPSELILGRYIDGELHIVGRATPIKTGVVAALRRQPREPEQEHPWPTVIHSTAYDRFNMKRDTPLTLIEPITVEVSADTSLAGDSLREPSSVCAHTSRARPQSGDRRTVVSDDDGLEEFGGLGRWRNVLLRFPGGSTKPSRLVEFDGHLPINFDRPLNEERTAYGRFVLTEPWS